MNRKWLSAYIYTLGKPESFLVKLYSGLVANLQKRQLIESFFFIRYYDTGPHIRLRLKGEDAKIDKEVMPILIEYLDSAREMTEKEDASAFRILSYTFVAYEPEVERYGGEEGILIAEDHFQASSLAILAMMAETEKWDYNAAIGSALQLHFSFLFSLSLLPETIHLLLDHIYTGWLPSAIEYPTLIDKRQPGYDEATLEAAYGKSYLKQQPGLMAIAATLHDMAIDTPGEAPGWHEKWTLHARETHDRIMGVVAERATDLDLARTMSEEFAAYLYQSYFHMTNNRLGLQNLDEAFIGYLIRRILEDIRYIPPKVVTSLS